MLCKKYNFTGIYLREFFRLRIFQYLHWIRRFTFPCPAQIGSKRSNSEFGHLARIDAVNGSYYVWLNTVKLRLKKSENNWKRLIFKNYEIKTNLPNKNVTLGDDILIKTFGLLFLFQNNFALFSSIMYNVIYHFSLQKSIFLLKFLVILLWNGSHLPC